MTSEQGSKWAMLVAVVVVVAAVEPSCSSLVIGVVVVNPAIVTLMVLVVAIISAVVETFSVVASSATASPWLWKPRWLPMAVEPCLL